MTPRKPYQRADYSLEEIDAHREKLTSSQYNILKAAVGATTYEIVRSRLNIRTVGTVKSRLNRAREALALHIKMAEKTDMGDSTVLGSG